MDSRIRLPRTDSSFATSNLCTLVKSPPSLSSDDLVSSIVNICQVKTN
jgi:hypothetical protein